MSTGPSSPYNFDPSNSILSERVVYVDANGSGDTDDIAEAAGFDVDVIIVRPGTYNIDNSAGVIQLGSKKLISTGGPTKTIITSTTVANSVFELDSDDSQVIGFRFTGQGNANTVPRILSSSAHTSGHEIVTDCVFFGGVGIQCTLTTVNVIRRCAFSNNNSGTGAIYISGGFSLVVDYCEFASCSGRCVETNINAGGVGAQILIKSTTAKFFCEALLTVTGGSGNHILQNNVGDTNTQHFINHGGTGTVVSIGDSMVASFGSPTPFAELTSTGNVRVQGSSYRAQDINITSTGEMEGFFFDLVGQKLVDYADTDVRSVTVFRDGGGDYDTIDEALDYLETLTGYSLSNRPKLILGAGVFPVTNTTVPRDIMNFISIEGQGPSVSFIEGTNSANGIFRCDVAKFNGVTFGNCDIAVDRLPAATGLISLLDCQLNGGNTLIREDGGLAILENCSSLSNTGTVAICDAATIFALLNCSFSTPVTGNTFIEINGGNVEIRGCTLDSTLIANTTGLSVTGGARVVCQANNYNDCEDAIIIANAALEYYSKGEQATFVTGGSNSITVEGAGGTSSATVHIADFTAPISTMVLNGNMPELFTVTDSTTGLLHTGNDIVVHNKYNMMKTSRFRRGF